MELSQKTRNELIAICKERGMSGYSSKKKQDILMLLQGGQEGVAQSLPDKIYRLNYIGSKFKLLGWITEQIKDKTEWESFEGKRIADLFAGTGIVSYHFRLAMATVVSNDAELYSSIISHAFAISVFTDRCKDAIKDIQEGIDGMNEEAVLPALAPGFITRNYSPYEEGERMFFTIDNAKKIDYARSKLEEMKHRLTEDEYKFVLASIIISADAVSNVPAVYGCFLKNFKDKALKPFVVRPIHTLSLSVTGCSSYNKDVLADGFLESIEADVAYIDPPYNERQYSKNYFPLNIIAKTPDDLLSESPLTGKTGIPQNCFMSPFCKKGAVAERAFEHMIQRLGVEWIFLSYNTEGIVPKEKMIEIMERYGSVSVAELDYKRFKSYQYNTTVPIKEYLFCLHKD